MDFKNIPIYFSLYPFLWAVAFAGESKVVEPSSLAQNPVNRTFDEVPVVPLEPGETQLITEQRLLQSVANVLKIAKQSKMNANIEELYHAPLPESCRELVGQARADEIVPLTRQSIQTSPYLAEMTPRRYSQLDQGRLKANVGSVAFSPTEMTEDMFREIEIYRTCGGKIRTGLDHPSIHWSSDVKGAAPAGTSPYLLVPKLVLALARGDTARFFPTGLEQDLKVWISHQEDGSVTPPELFGEAVRMAKGDVFLALLSIENVLSENWICPNRDASSWLKKVRPIGKFWLEDHTPDSDEFGGWYHFFGLLLTGYAYGGAAGSFSGYVESGIDFLGHVLHGEPAFAERQEGFIGRHAGGMGGAIRRGVLNAENSESCPSGQGLSSRGSSILDTNVSSIQCVRSEIIGAESAD